MRLFAFIALSLGLATPANAVDSIALLVDVSDSTKYAARKEMFSGMEEVRKILPSDLQFVVNDWPSATFIPKLWSPRSAFSSLKLRQPGGGTPLARTMRVWHTAAWHSDGCPRAIVVLHGEPDDKAEFEAFLAELDRNTFIAILVTGSRRQKANTTAWLLQQQTAAVFVTYPFTEVTFLTSVHAAQKHTCYHVVG